ncbi:ABC transporter substrate-binding protein [Frankia nepalensis]|uniref:ABC transporter substrate-binding protein n=1 Tax=Frankia nepalensis TaxID=1836974 RepID=A0A937UPY2_9ACTN|nr:ABC transporter substrate-binding protein [Frankia nepalensis]MBL7499018.1 ABC transporter substrate-binding protein [Frankia nepalensis]MBL7510160.1 ABC transporter substrate-binding protein [Frankia nepalensis]MBL7626056.1 ABC transporter substrate-binding protein [Frankia nepalensis]
MKIRATRRRRAAGALLGVIGLVGVLAAAGCAGSSGSAGPSATGSDPVKVSIFEVAQADVVTTLETAFKEELTAKLAGRTVSFSVRNANGDPSLIQSIARDLARSDASLIAVIGTPAVIAMAQQDKTHPIIALAMGDPVGGKVADSLDHPGRNVTGTIDFIDPAQLLDELAEVTPAPRRIGTIYDPSNENSQVWVAQLRAAVEGRPGMSLAEATVAGAGDVQSAARSLVGRTDTILVGPDAAVASGVAAVGAVALSNKIPLYLTSGDAATTGVLATLGPSYADLGVASAGVAAKIIEGAIPADTPFGRPGALEWGVNRDTLSALGVTLPAAATG